MDFVLWVSGKCRQHQRQSKHRICALHRVLMFGEKSVIGTHLVFEKILQNLPSEIALSLTKFPKHSKVEVRFFFEFCFTIFLLQFYIAA